MSLITTAAHAYAVALGDIKKVGHFVESAVLPVQKTLHGEAATIEAITALVSPQLADIERTGDALLGIVIKAIDDAGVAAGASGLSVSLDGAIVADIKAIMATVKSKAAVIAPAVTQAA